MTKKYRVIIDPLAKADLQDLYVYVSVNDNINSANKLLDGLEEAFYKLEKYPERGHIPPELRQTGIKNYLEIHYKPYRIIYEIEGKVVYIHSVIDGRRNIQEILHNRILR
jgi:toxin ParE1/3/4